MPARTLLRRRATSTRLRLAWLAAVVVVVAFAQEEAAPEEEAHEEEAAEEVSMVVTFVNEMPNTPIELFWENKAAGDRKTEGTIPPRGGFIDVKTFEGHEFSYDLDGARHYLTPQTTFAVLAGDAPDIRVRCILEREMEPEKGPLGSTLEITVHPYWAPRGASRFLELVREKYYDGVALNRVVPAFLLQFGIARGYEQRMKWDELPIDDDVETAMAFEEGSVSFAGSGTDSRTTEIFIVMPGTEREQLEYFGTNEWEIPFGRVEAPGEGVLTKIYDAYGDVPPWGDGPDPDRMYDADGYTTYLPENFPKIDYIDRCFVVNEELAGDLAAEL